MLVNAGDINGCAYQETCVSCAFVVDLARKQDLVDKKGKAKRGIEPPSNGMIELVLLN